MTRTEGRLYAFATDLLDEPDRVPAAAAELGLGGVAVTLAYHQARDLLPHPGTKPRLRYREDGVFFRPDPARWRRSPIVPPVQPDDQVDAVERLRRRSDVEVEAWTVFLHNTSIGAADPSLASRTCFGDAVASNLCPANPAVAAYAHALADEVSTRGYDVIAEALSAQTFAHGHHHERSFTPLGESELDLLGLCFCASCAGASSALGLDVAALRERVADVLQAAFAGAPSRRPGLDALVEELGSDLLQHVRARVDAVTRLAQEVAEVVHRNGRRFSFMDLTGAVLGYGDGVPQGLPHAEQSWRIGIDPSGPATAADSYSVLGYCRDEQRLASDVASVRAAVGRCRLRVILRPGFPDHDDAEHLARAAATCRAAGADQVDFYNFGMYDESVLARIAATEPD